MNAVLILSFGYEQRRAILLSTAFNGLPIVDRCVFAMRIISPLEQRWIGWAAENLKDVESVFFATPRDAGFVGEMRPSPVS
jgi:hypothetical protein